MIAIAAEEEEWPRSSCRRNKTRDTRTLPTTLCSAPASSMMSPQGDELGIRQVLPAAAMDERAYRIAWPDGTALYEIDHPELLAARGGTRLPQHPPEVDR
jgi:hypothetical protein